MYIKYSTKNTTHIIHIIPIPNFNEQNHRHSVIIIIYRIQYNILPINVIVR